ncbi:MAG: hypothetical protein ACXWFC_08310 [Nitrososphaeraceae archaeon]
MNNLKQLFSMLEGFNIGIMLITTITKNGYVSPENEVAKKSNNKSKDSKLLLA